MSVFQTKNTQFWVVDVGDFNNFLGDLDLHLLDLILKGKVTNSMKVLDAGCGTGRNLIYFLNSGLVVTALDAEKSNVATTNLLSRAISGKDVCVHGDLIKLPFEDATFDLIVCSRVLHFANSQEQFLEMCSELRRVLSPTGVLYLTMASYLGLEEDCRFVGDGKFFLPDGNLRFLFTTDLLGIIEEKWVHEEPVRTVLFGKEHAETTLVLRPKFES